MRDTRSRYDQVANVYWPIMVGVVVLVAILAIVFVVLFRARGGSQPGDGAGQTPVRSVSRVSEAPFVESVFVVLLILVVAFLLWRTYSVQAGEDNPSAKPAETVVVTAARWHWRFDYPGGVSQIGTDRQQPPLIVPQNTPIRFRLTSIDVIHAFWIPGRRYKRDANPGAFNAFQMTFPNLGRFHDAGQCSEFCGLRHSQMRFDVDVRTPAAYRAWLAARIAARRAALGAVVTR